MRPALAFELGCPECGGRLDLESAAKPATRSTSAVLRCADCAITVRVSVSMRVCDARRYDLDPLAQWITRNNDTTIRGQGFDVNCDVSFIANRLGVDRATVHYYRRNGLSDATADRLATRLGLHPSEIWPQWWPEEVPA